MRAHRPTLLPFLAVLFCRLAPSADEGVVISEFMAENGSTLRDEDGDSSDWVEIHNSGVEAVDLDGWSLTDSLDEPRKWTFPRVRVGPGAFVVIFASGKDRRDSRGELHANFSLDADGEYLALIPPGGESAPSEFTPAFPPQRRDVSFGTGWRPAAKLVSADSRARVSIPRETDPPLEWTGGRPFDDGPGSTWFSAAAAAGYHVAPAVPIPPPLGFWGFDGTLADLSGNLHEGRPNGPRFSAATSPNGGDGRSLDFDGKDDFVRVAIDISETAFTLSLWLRTETPTGGLFCALRENFQDGLNDRNVYLEGGEIRARLAAETIGSSGLDLADGGWHHVTYSFGGALGGQKLHVDGRLVAEGRESASRFTSQEFVAIGLGRTTTPPYFRGQIDEVAIWDEALTAAQMQELATGRSPLEPPGFEDLIRSDLRERLRGVSRSLCMRIPFEYEHEAEGPELGSVRLRMGYDDGFRAFLNGVEIARRDGRTPFWPFRSASPDRASSTSYAFEDIEVPWARDLVRDGTNILAILGVNSSAESRDFLIVPELEAGILAHNVYLARPTPGRPNGSGLAALVSEVRFSSPRGFYSEPVRVELSTATPGAIIEYTLDGSRPNPGNPASRRYREALTISRATVLRAAAFKEGCHPSAIRTHSYIVPRDVARQPAHPPGLPSVLGGVAADYEVDPDVVRSTLPGYGFEEGLRSIPAISLTLAPDDLFGEERGILHHPTRRGRAWERPCSVELLRHDGRPGFQVDAGVRLQGNSSRWPRFCQKKSFRLEFRGEYGPRRLEYPLFSEAGPERFDELVLRGCSSDSWAVTRGFFVAGLERWDPGRATYLRDQWMRDSQIAMGHPSARGIYVHVFLNGLYWGLYNLTERLARPFHADRSGEEEGEYDIVRDFAELHDGSKEAWDEMMALAEDGLEDDEAYLRIQGMAPDGRPDPGLPRYLDVENLIDYMILHVASGAEDWPHHNWWAARRKGAGSEGFRFFVWDQEIAVESLVRARVHKGTRIGEPHPGPNPSFLAAKLASNPRYRRRFADRVHQLLFQKGALTPARCRDRWLARVREIDRAIVCESARWGDSMREPPYRREVEWLAELRWMEERYWPWMRELAIHRFRGSGMYPGVEAPRFDVSGPPRQHRTAGSGERLAMFVPYRREVVLVSSDAPKRACTPANDLGVAWYEPSYAEGSRGERWTAGTGDVGFDLRGKLRSIGLDVGPETARKASSVFIRIPFTIEDARVIEELESSVLRIAYDDGFVAYLNGTRIAAANAPPGREISWDSTATALSEANLDFPEPFNVSSFRNLLRPGRNLLAIHALNYERESSDLVISVELRGRYPETADPRAAIYYTINAGDPLEGGALRYEHPIRLAETATIRARARLGDEWSALAKTELVVK